MTKKIGILTFQNANNYGAMCQMLALHKILEKAHSGISEVINVHDLKIENRYRLLHPTKNLKSKIKQIILIPFCFATSIKFRIFRKKARFTPKIEKSALRSLEYEKIIVGSDQVWNITLTGYDSIYFLDWFLGKKYSYAASFGVSEFDKEFDREIPKLKDFEKISVREGNAINYLKKNNIISQTNIDPSFLLNKSEWLDFAISPKQSEYILIYTIGYSDDIINFAKDISKRNGNIPIFCISNDILYKKGIKMKRGIGPAEWIGYFCNAKYIITNSFHGLAFAINFNVEFFYNDSMTTSKDTNARIKSLLDIFGISGRHIYEKNYDKIDWEMINCIIENEKTRSYEYINSIIEN